MPRLFGEIILRIFSIDPKTGKEVDMARNSFGVHSSSVGVEGIATLLRDATSTTLQDALDTLQTAAGEAAQAQDIDTTITMPNDPPELPVRTHQRKGKGKT